MATLHLTKDNFKEKVLESDKTVLVDFWADWCNPCKMMAPVFEEASNEYEDAVFGKVNVDEESDLAREYRVMNIPTIMAFKNGELVDKVIGVQPKSAILDLAKR
ncbi:MAG: thioredoxin [Clostridia bacterium]|nr:thioredoxin [Clostridia bacterium]